MYRKLTIGLILLALTNVVIAAEKAMSAESNEIKVDQNEPNYALSDLEGIKLPQKDDMEYWVIRSQAVNELTSFLTTKRANLQAKLVYFVDYINLLGKTDDMLSADIEISDDPLLRVKALGIEEELAKKNISVPKKPLDWEQLVEFSMRYIMSEGYSPIQILDMDELESFKNILSRNEQFCMKVRKDTNDIVDKVVRSWIYLGMIGKQKDFRLYVVEQEKLKKETRDRQRQAILEKQAEEARQRREMQKQTIWQERQNRLQNQYNQGGYYY